MDKQTRMYQRFEEARDLHEAGRTAKAVELLEANVRDGTNAPGQYGYLASIYRDHGRYADEARVWRASLPYFEKKGHGDRTRRSIERAEKQAREAGGDARPLENKGCLTAVLLFALILVAAAPAAAQPTASPETVYVEHPKNPRAGLLFGALVTGGGHVYAGEWGRAGALFGTGLAGVGLIYLDARGVFDCTASSCEDGYPGTTIATYGALALGAAWFISVYDGRRAALRANRRAAATLHPAGRGVGLAVRW